MADITLHPLRASLQAGKLIGYEIYQSGGTLVDKVTFETPISNYMNTVALSRLVQPTSRGRQPMQSGMPELFRYAQLGTGTSPNPRSDQNLELAILSRVDLNNSVDASGTGTGGFKKSDVNYTYTYTRRIPTIDPETSEAYNNLRVRVRMSHRHTMVPANQGGDVIVSEVGWSSVSSGTMTSRIVLPPDKRITLRPEQFLVTIYEVEAILPDLRIRPFSNLPISGAFQWSALSTYALNQLVTNDGVNYKSLIANNIGNVPADSPQAWVVDNTTPLVLSGVYAFREGHTNDNAPRANLQLVAAFSTMRGNYDNASVSSGDNSPYPNFLSLSNESQILAEGWGRGFYYISSMSWDVSQASTGKLTGTGTIARDDSAPNYFIRSIYIFGHQFLLDLPICRSTDQQVSITASVQWSLTQES